MASTIVSGAAPSPATADARASTANVWYSMMINLQKNKETKLVKNSWAWRDELSNCFTDSCIL